MSGIPGSGHGRYVMDIVCPKCKTTYEFDGNRVTPTGIAVRCTHCDYTFKVRRREVVEVEPTSSPSLTKNPDARVRQSSGNGADGRARPWMIRTQSGEVLNFQELPTLHQWVIERRVHPDDQISRSGETWKRLGDIEELAPHFTSANWDPVLEVSQVTPTGPTTFLSNSEHGVGAGPQSMGDVAALVDEPAFALSGASFAQLGGTAAWEDGGANVVAADLDESQDVQLPKRGAGKYLGLVLLSGVLVALGGGLALKPQLFKSFITGLLSDEAAAKEVYAKGRELFLKDDEGSLDRADQTFAQSDSQTARLRAARAQVYTVWAQHLRDQAELLDRQVARINNEVKKIRANAEQAHSKQHHRGRGKRRGRGATTAGLQLAAAERLLAEVDGLTARATKYRTRATERLHVAAAQLKTTQSADRAEVFRAMADLHRLEGKDDVLKLLSRVRKTMPTDPEARYIEAMYWLAKGDVNKAREMLNASNSETRALTKQPLLRAVFQLAMIALRAGQLNKARQLANQILDENPQHNWAQALLKQIDAESPGKAPKIAAKGAAAAVQSRQAVVAAPKPQPAPRQVPTAKRPAKTRKPNGKKPQAVRKSPRTYAALVEAGNHASEHGRTMQAISYFERALAKKNNKGVEAITGIAYCELDLQRFSSAVKRFKRAVALSPRYGDAVIGMAEAYLAMGEKRKALDYYKAYLRVQPNGPKASLAQRNIRDLTRKLSPQTDDRPLDAVPPPLEPEDDTESAPPPPSVQPPVPPPAPDGEDDDPIPDLSPGAEGAGLRRFHPSSRPPNQHQRSRRGLTYV